MAGTHYCPQCLTTFQGNPTTCPNLGCGVERAVEGWGNLLEAGDLLDRHYRILKVLAVGGAGLTYLAREVDSSGEPRLPDLAIKVLYTARSGGSFVRRLANEAQILQELDHDNIVQCRGFVHRTGSEPYLVTLYEQGGSLGDFVNGRQGLGPRVAAGVLRQILLALDVAHQRGVVHRDLKPDNVLLSQSVGGGTIPHVRVADFGIAKVSGALGSQLTKAGTFIGTPEYAAPEQFENRPPSPATDVFAAGAVLVFLLTGRPPCRFTGRADLETTYEELLDQIPPRLTVEDVPDATLRELAILQEIVDNTMEVDAEDRWTVHQILARLSELLVGGLGAAERTTSTLDITTDSAPDRNRGPALPPAQTSARSRPQVDPPAPLVAPKGSSPGEQGGCLVGALAGLGASSTAVVAVAGSMIVVSLLILGAAQWGWLRGPQLPVARLPPNTIDVGQVQELRGARQLLGGSDAEQAARQALQLELDGHAAGIGKACREHGLVVAELLLTGKGQVAHAWVDDGYLQRARCVEGRLELLVLTNPLGRAARARVGFIL